MDGVTILHSYTALTLGDSVVVAIGVSMSCVFLGICLACIGEGSYKTAALLGVCAVGLMLAMVRFIPTTQYHEILLDDKASWQEVTDTYIVDKTRGKILTVRER